MNSGVISDVESALVQVTAPSDDIPVVKGGSRGDNKCPQSALQLEVVRRENQN